MDPAAIARGRADGEANLFRLTAEDILEHPETALAYLNGFHQARRQRRGH
jgi:hypothetical protein